MGSLFDLAAELSQYDEAREPVLSTSAYMNGTARDYHDHKPSRGNPVRLSITNNQNADDSVPDANALSLLDEALSTIYAARQPQSQRHFSMRNTVPTLTTQRSAPQLLRDQSSNHFTVDPDRNTKTTYSTTPLQNVFAHSVMVSSNATKKSSGRTIPPPPLSPPPPLPVATRPVQSTEDPDVVARRTLREIQEEMEHLPKESTMSPRRLQHLQHSLSDKYLQNRLNQLPSTPFVQLARKKTQQKINNLKEKGDNTSTTPILLANLPTQSSPSIFPQNQHEQLLKLAQIPDNHIAKLSTTQQQMVQFAKRYSKVLRLSSDELQQLPVSQAQLLQQLQQQLPSLRNRK